eukprot:GHVU01157398.1.p1 GENE.GHVU01157398.1~~GHVU01157398.1.p1  ORF type:complete len:156 (+),score=29.37 GHVU01157398.1:230-697(+)
MCRRLCDDYNRRALMAIAALAGEVTEWPPNLSEAQARNRLRNAQESIDNFSNEYLQSAEAMLTNGYASEAEMTGTYELLFYTKNEVADEMAMFQSTIRDKFPSEGNDAAAEADAVAQARRMAEGAALNEIGRTPVECALRMAKAAELMVQVALRA